MASLDASKVRNVGILGHGGTGKTILIEHILHAAGKTNRLGKISEGNTVGDYLDQEIERQQTLCLKLMHCDWNGTRIYIVDHPGYMDFLGEVAASTPILDGVVIVVDATTGVQVGTDNAFHYADRYHIPRMLFINKLDRENTDFDAVVNVLQKTYGSQCAPLVIPVGQAASLSAVVNILTGNHPDVADVVESLKSGIVETVAESDDALLEKYLDKGELTAEEFSHGLQQGIQSGRIVPIVAGSAEKGLGVRELMDLIAGSFPSPLDRKVVATDAAGKEVLVKVSPDESFQGQVFRSVVDPYVGQLTYFRVLTGTLRSDSEFLNVTTGSKERSGKIYLMCGKQQSVVDAVGPGDLAAMTKLKHTHFGDTIGAPGTKIQMPKIELPESMVKLAIFPKSRADEDKIGEALNRMSEEDPTFKHYRDASTNEHVIRGMGDLQLEIILDRMKRKFNVEAETRTPKVAYKETVKGNSNVQGKHKKQTGGHGQY
ncbi:MAG: GTP-binding protein, partial [Candidatus Hydrogenedentes bacterium]|nr:GTP-binding protein [Candidatus Hydrogenedentota bacterium]